MVVAKSDEIFLLREVPQGPQDICELSQNFLSHKNQGCLGVNRSGLGFLRENEYFSFKKNIPKVILWWIRSEVMVWERSEHLGESQGCPSVEVQMKRLKNSKFQQLSNENSNKKERAKTRLSQTSPTQNESRPRDLVTWENHSGY